MTDPLREEVRAAVAGLRERRPALTSAFVVDASMAFTWVLPSPASSEAVALLEGVKAGAGAVVPPLWYLEVAIGPPAAERRRLVTGDERRQSPERLSAPALSVVEDDARNAFGRTSSLAE